MRGRRRQRAPANDPAIGRELDIEIRRIGKSGDGIAEHDGKPLYVPLALPGDRLSVRLSDKRGDGYAAETVQSRDLMPRRAPACRHFGACGGCRLQHLPVPVYRDWKQQQIRHALGSRGIENVDIRPLIDAQPETRRRLRLAFVNAGGRALLGHRRRGGREIVDIGECPIALPAITALFEPLRRTLAALDMAREGGEVSLTSAHNGVDLLIECRSEPTLADREGLAALAEQEDFSRIAWRSNAASDAEPVAARREVIIRFGDVPAALPSGAFLQATEAAERAIVKAVTSAIDGSERVADLFSGCGAIGLPLASEGRKVRAFERDPAMVRTLGAAARRAGLEARIQAESRDLDGDPLTGSELTAFDALILDPPRAGARAQVDGIANGQGPLALVMASCNPATFARDARTLIDAGYRLDWLQPIDAFLFAADIELVAAFTLAKTP